MREKRLGTKKKIILRVFAITLSFLVAFSGINPAIFASADNGTNEAETINYAVRVSFAPQSVGQEVETGLKGAFVLHVECAHANDQTTPVQYKVRIPDNIVQLPDFKDSDTYISKATREEFKLETDNDGYRYICGQILPGQTIEQPFRVFYPNGVTPDTELTVTEKDITVDKPAAIPGNVVKEGGTIHYKAKFEWEPLNKVANVEKLKADATGVLTKDIIYTLTAKSKQNQRHKGGIYTKEYTLTDTMTLPEGLTFPAGDLSWQKNNTMLMSGDIKVADFSEPIISAQISEDRRTLDFVYKETNDTLSEPAWTSEDPKEIKDLKLVVTINRTALTIDYDTFNKDKQIDNEAKFNAVPCLPAEEHNSEDEVPIVLPKPGDDFTVEKTSAVNTEKLKNGSQILYTITVRNNNPVPIVVDIKDSAPENTTYIDGSADNGGIATATAEGMDIVWQSVKINAGSYAKRSFKVRVNSDLPDGTIIENTAVAEFNGNPKISNIVEDEYHAPKPDLEVEKTNSKENQMVSEGGTVNFTIKVTNDGDAAGSDVITDKLSKHLTLIESSLPAGATYDEASRTISIPVKVEPGSTNRYSFSCKVQAASWLASGSSISNTAVLKNEGEKSTTSFLYKEKKHSLSIKKSMNEIVERPDLGDKWYQVSYRLTISNKGGPLWASQGEKVTDTMSGGLIPLEVKEKEIYEAAGIWTVGGNSQNITGSIKKNSFQTSDQYVTTWALGNIAAGQKATIDYKAIVYLENGIMDMANTTNVAQIYKANGSGSGVPPVPKPSSDKVITKVNGEEPEDDKYCEIHPGDVITYKLMAKNTGTGTQYNVLLTDALPEYNEDSGFGWVIGKNVKIEGNFQGTPVHSNDALVWEKSYIQAKKTYNVYVTLTFPKGTMFDKAFSEERSRVYNTFTLQTDKVKQVHTVTHDTIPVTMSIDKAAENRMAYVDGEAVTFTIDGFSADYPVDGLKVTDNLEKAGEALSLTSINTGAYQITGKDTYNIVLGYDNKAAETITVKTADGNKSIVLTAAQQQDLKTVVWDFGDVDAIDIQSAPQLIMTVKDINKPMTVKNYANVVYNERMTGDDIEVRAMPDNMIDKAAYKNGMLVNNEGNPLAEGDTVKFIMSYTNYENENLDMTKVTIRDMMTVEGLKPNQTVNVNMTHFGTDGKAKTNSDLQLATGSFTIKEADIKSPLAKRIDLKFSKGTLKAGEKVQFEYSVIVGDGFKDSMGDVNMGYTSNYDGKRNLRALHNELSVIIDGESYNTQTDFYYREGESQMYFQKGVFASGYINARNHTSTQYRYAYRGMGSKDVTKINNINQSTRSTKNFFDYTMVVYSMVVYNSDSSPRNMTVDQITDKLPAGSTFCGIQVLDKMDFKNRGETTKQNSASIKYTGFANTGVNVPLGSMTAANIINSSRPYKVKPAFVQPKYDTSNRLVTFTVTTQGNTKEKLVLKPGEALVFAYGVSYTQVVNPLRYTKANDNGGGYGIPKYGSYTNTATLKTAETGFVPLADKTISTKTPGTIKNDGGCLQTAGNSYESSVTLQENKIKAGLEKKAIARYSSNGMSDTQIFNAAKNGTLKNKSTNMDQLGFGDIVEWEITLDYAGTHQELIQEMMRWKYGTITDQIPEPYRIIGDSSGNNLIMEYTAKAGKKTVIEKAKITNNGDAFFGEAGQTFVWQPDPTTVQRPADFDITGSKITFRYYTKYDQTEGKAYINYNNIATYTFDERYIDESTAGQPIRTNNKITAIRAEADVFPGAGEMSGSYKTIDYVDENGKKASANSVTGSHKISVVKNDPLVDYTLTVKNQSPETYENLVLIDRLPDEGDVGTVNSAAQRGSQFSIELPAEPKTEVYLTAADGNKRLLTSSEYSISYTKANKENGYTPAEWAATDSKDWTASPQEANSVRIKLAQPLAKDAQIDVKFKAYITGEADPGEIAWNSFGFRFENKDVSTKPTYAEPAKVGVELPAGTIQVTKKGSDNKLLAGAEFTLYTDRECQVPYMKNGKTVVLSTGSDGKAKATGLELDRVYWAKETKTPQGYIIPNDVDNLYKIELTTAKPNGSINGGTVINEVEEKKGSFIIAKRVEGTPTSEKFTIVVTGNFINGINRVEYKLADGEYVEVKGTILGETYTVTEQIHDKYYPQYYVAVGTDINGGNKVTVSEADCEVLIDNFDKKESSLYISKKVNGQSKGETFKIIVTGNFMINGQKVKMAETVFFGPDEYGTVKEVKNVIPGETYSITESATGYVAQIVAVDGEALNKNKIEISSGDFTEVDVINTEATEIAGTKTWNDGGDEEAVDNRPAEVKIKLYQNGEEFKGGLYPDGVTTASADTGWEYKFTNLPKYDDNGNTYTYTVEEVVTDETAGQYVSTVDGYDITNTSLIDLSGEKIWIDGGLNGMNISEIKVQLYQGTESDDADPAPYGNVKTVYEKDDWAYTFEDLPEYDEDGSRYIYTIEEVNVPAGYTVNYPGTGEAGTTEDFDIDIINTLQTEISGEKIWVDDNDAHGIRPDEITIQLMRYLGESDTEGEEISAVKVKKAEDWKYSFENLPVYSPNGLEYIYKVEEVGVPARYTVSYDGYDVINTIEPDEPSSPGFGTWHERIDFSGTKIWNDDNSASRPDEISVQLYQKLETEGQTFAPYGDPVKVTYSDDWKYVFTDLPKYDRQGTLYSYMVKEVEVPTGYTVSYEGTNIINTQDPAYDPDDDIPGYAPPTVKLSIGGQKIWDDMDDYAKMRPGEITVQLYQDGEAYGDPVTITAEDEWKYSFNDLPKFDAADPDSEDYVYTIEEVNVPEGYAVRYDGYNIINDIDDKYLPEPPKEPEDPQEPQDPRGPEKSEDATDTGDHNMILFWALQLMILSAAIMIILMILQRKPSRRKY